MAHLSSIATADPADWWLSFEINIKGNFNLVRAFFPHAAEGASIIHVSSNVIHGLCLPGYSSYRASKAGAHKLFAYLSEERPDLFILQIHPGFIATEIFNKMELARILKRHCRLTTVSMNRYRNSQRTLQLLNILFCF
jgi:NAD(P)-dependent dehydrogenase (short-subunit alcohol dehydrogenase family)